MNWIELRYIVCEILVKIDPEFSLDLALVDLEIAHQLHDRFFADVIVRRHAIADMCRRLDRHRCAA